MTLLQGIKRQLRSVIEWRDQDPNALFEQWSENGDEIKNASKLIVGPGQGCIFVYEGRVRAVHDHECLIALETANLPFWTTIKKFMQSFESEHKVGVYFFRTTRILNQKWGTLSPIKYQDPKFNFPVGVKAFGNFSFRIVEPKKFFVNVVGNQGGFTVEQFRKVMAERMLPLLTDHIATSKFSYIDIDANRNELSEVLARQLSADFTKLGFEITDFRIEGTDFDDDTRRRIARIADLTAEAQAAKAAGLSYEQILKLEALKEAAQNEGGGAGLGMGLGAGLGMGQTLAQSMGQTVQAGKTNTVPTSADPADKLSRLKNLHQQGLITDDEYAAKKKEILATL